MDSNPIYDYNNNDENRSLSSLGFISDSDEFTGVVQVVIWENGKTAKNTFTIEITSTINYSEDAANGTLIKLHDTELAAINYLTQVLMYEK